MADANYVANKVSAATLNGGAWNSLLAAQAQPFRSLAIFNATDAALQYSFDAGVTIHGYVPAGGTEYIDYASNGQTEPSALSVKQDAAMTAGKNVYGNARF